MTVLALHGFWGSPRDWKPLSDHLFDLPWDWVTPDLHSPEVSGFSGMSEWSEWLRDQVKDVDPRNLAVIGYSMGGRWALRALLDGLQTHRFVALSANPFSLSWEEKEERRQNDSRWAHRFLDGPVEALAAAWQSQAVLSTSALKTFRPLTDEVRQSLAWALTHGSLAQQPDLRPALNGMTSSPLWLVGDRDTKYLGIQQRMVREGWPGKFVALQGVGHRLLLDDPQQVADQLRTHWA